MRQATSLTAFAVGGLLTILAAVPARAAPQDIVLRNPSNSVHVRIHTCGKSRCGTVVWANAKAKADSARGGTPNLVGTELFHGVELQRHGRERPGEHERLRRLRELRHERRDQDRHRIREFHLDLRCRRAVHVEVEIADAEDAGNTIRKPPERVPRACAQAIPRG